MSRRLTFFDVGLPDAAYAKEIAMPPALFRFDDYAEPGERFHVIAKTVGATARMHRHDYFELFLVEAGTVLHRTARGAARLEPGTLVFLRPEDAHSVQGHGRPARILNLMFHAETAAHLIGRYETELRGRFFWREAPEPVVLPLAGSLRVHVRRDIEGLRTGPRGLARIERVLMVLLTDLLAGEAAPPGMPAWLAEACRAAREPEVFRMGGAGFVAAAGRAHEHVCRQARRHLGMTPTQYVNRIRIEHAMMLLGSSDVPVAEIAERCGFEGAGHFHRLFRARYGATPSVFRRGAGDPV